ncbi:MAG TPA: VOC family protein [Rhizomicrobium sp.]|nr:VOC family protein [Rhizomicrobium sp.]
MLDHFGFYVRDAEKSLAFYRACLAPLGIEVVQVQRGGKAMIFQRGGERCFLWLGETGGEPRTANPGRSPIHLGFEAASTAQVDAFHAAALAAGGTDNGAPGWRNPRVYGAFAFDPDGNNIEADFRPG